MNEQIGNKINDKTYIKLTPFKGFVLENFPFIEADFDAITNYQLLCKVIEYLNNVISNQNTVQELGTDLVNAYNSLVDAVNLAINEFETDITGDFNTLHDYVYNYFDNLDVQEEINNKLDDMVEDGTFEMLLSHMYKYNYNFINLESYFEENLTFTQSLINALNDCDTLNKNLVIPNGEYELTSSINIKDIIIDGNNSVITYNGENNINYLITGNNINIKNIKFNLNNKSYSLLENKHFNNIEIDNIEVYNGITTINEGNYSQNYGLYLDGNNVILKNSKIYNNKGHGAGINPTTSNSSYYIDNCKFNNNGDTGNLSLGLINATRTSGNNYKILSITNCTAENNNNSGIATHQADNTHIINCNCNNNGEHGIVFMDCKNSTITNCTCLNNTVAGIRLQGDYSFNDEKTGVNNCVISNNVINGVYGINISNKCHDITILNNIINTTNLTIYISRALNDIPNYNLLIKNNYLTSNEIKTNGEIATNGYVENLSMENIVNGVPSHITKNYVNGRIFNYQELNYGNIANIVTDPYSILTSSQWTKLGTVDGSIINANSGGYYLAHIMELTKTSDFVSVIFKIDKDYSNEENLGITIECREGTTNRGEYSFRYTNINDYVAFTFKISDKVPDASVIDHLRIIILGTAGKHIRPVFALVNNSNILPVIGN